VRFAYADPPYPGQAKKHYEDHPDYAGEVDHAALITRLLEEYPDGWALSTSTADLRDLLPLVPERHRVLAWVKPFASWKPNVAPAFAWEPVIMVGGRNVYGQRQTTRDWVAATPPIFRGERGTKGMKPLEFCYWLFDCLGMMPGDELEDLFPGSGGVARAWGSWCAQIPLVFPSEPKTEAMFEEGAA
jgi:hypothetical protein